MKKFIYFIVCGFMLLNFPCLYGQKLPGTGLGSNIKQSMTVDTAKPGQPMEGVVVKGGGSSGTTDMVAVSNHKGEVLLDNLKAGSYVFQLYERQPPDPARLDEGAHNLLPALSNVETRISTNGSNTDGTLNPQNALDHNHNTVRSDKTKMAAEVGGITINRTDLKEVDDNILLNNETKLVYYNDKLYTYTGSDIEKQAIGNTIVACDCAGHKITIRVLDGSGTNACREACLRYLRNNVARHSGSGDTSNPQHALQGTGIRDNGLKRAEAARPGNPIGGIIVKGGRNPGGSMKTITVDEKGVIRFEVLEAGDYKLTIHAPGIPEK